MPYEIGDLVMTWHNSNDVEEVQRVAAYDPDSETYTLTHGIGTGEDAGYLTESVPHSDLEPWMLEPYTRGWIEDTNGDYREIRIRSGNDTDTEDPTYNIVVLDEDAWHDNIERAYIRTQRSSNTSWLSMCRHMVSCEEVCGVEPEDDDYDTDGDGDGDENDDRDGNEDITPLHPSRVVVMCNQKVG